MAFQCIFEMVSKNYEPIDIMTVSEYARTASMKEIDEVALMELSNAASSPNLEYHCKRIKDASKLRVVISSCAEALEMAFKDDANADDVIGTVQTNLFEIDTREKQGGPIKINESMSAVMEKLNSMAHNTCFGIPSYISGLDALTSGFQKSELTILAARPSMGKTSLAMQIAIAASLSDYKTLIFSLEMGRDALIMRELCANANISLHSIRQGTLAQTRYPKLGEAALRLNEASCWIDDTPAITPIKMISRAKRIKKLYGLDLVVIDYLQLARWHEKTQSREQEISKISAALKVLAKEVDCHVIALSQLSRAVESRQDKRPMNSDLRDSGSIEQDADNILFMFRESYYNKGSDSGETELILSKQRNGPVGTVYLDFIKGIMRFEEIQKDKRDDDGF
jgi:replicative DNA helicase